MFARVTTTKGQVTKQEAARVVRDRVLPGAKAIPGFKGGLWLIDEKGGKGLTITLFESEETLRASAEAAEGLRKGAVGELGVSVASVESYEVIVAAGVAEPITA